MPETQGSQSRLETVTGLQEIHLLEGEINSTFGSHEHGEEILATREEFVVEK